MNPLSDLTLAPTPEPQAATPPAVLLVDGHSLAFRSYYAHTKGRDGGLRTSTGIPTSVTFGFLKALLEVLDAEKPDYVAVAFDLDEPTFRHQADETYKAGRQEAPEEFFPDLANLQEVLAAMQVAIVTQPGFEADDVLGTLVHHASQAGYRVKVLSGDQDMFQLVDDAKGVSVMHLSSAFAPRTNGAIAYSERQVQEKLGILPAQVVDYKALCGDSSDNIPGVKGIGAKTAAQLLNTYGSLEAIYASLDQIKGAVKQKLEQGKTAAFHSQFMARIRVDVPIACNIEDCKVQGFDRSSLDPLIAKLEFHDRTLLKRIDRLASGTWKTDDAPSTAPSTIRTTYSDDDTWFFSADDTTHAQQQQTDITLDVDIIDTPEKLTALVQALQACTTPVAWDTETTALDPRDADLVGIGCCYQVSGFRFQVPEAEHLTNQVDLPLANPSVPHPSSFDNHEPPTNDQGQRTKDKAQRTNDQGQRTNDQAQIAYIPIGHKLGNTLDKAMVLEALRPVLESDRYPKVLQNAKFDRLIFRAQGIELRGVVFDTMLASYVLNPEGSHNLTDLASRYLSLVATSYSDLVPKGKTIADIAIPTVAQYCGMDVYSTFHLMPLLQAELAQIPSLDRLLTEVEQPLEPVLATMEYTGFRIDQAYLREFSRTLEHDLAEIERSAYAAAGEQFNLGSPKQLGDLLFEKLGLDKRKSRKMKTGYSTDATVLEKLQGDHPVIDLILEHRTLSKLKSTYVDALPQLVRKDTERVHTDFNQAVTATGRLSSSNPNLQNIPIRTAFSRQIRKAFVPEPGWVLVAADYSQIELRILAHLSQEPILLETYQQNRDVHTLTAQMLFDKQEITPDERRLGKVINFGVIYGMGAQRFAREANVPTAEAKGFIDRFNDRYPLVFEYLQQKQREAIAQGYVETIRGRRRYFNFTSDSLRSLRGSDAATIDLNKLKIRDQYEAQSLRAAANAPIQGSSADIIKLAMVKIHKLLQTHRARLLLQVHDELVFEMPPDEWEALQPAIKSTMESALALSVPLVVDIHAGQNWMDAKV